MVTIPASPKEPTVFVIGEKPATPLFRSIIEAGIKAFKAEACKIENLAINPDISAADRSAILEFLQDEYNARGAFVVEHAPDFFVDARDAYDEVDNACNLLGEVGVIIRSPGQLRAAAPRLVSAIRAIDRILPADTEELLILGAGPDARAMTAAVSMGECAARPSKVTIASTDAKGLADVRLRIADLVKNTQLEIRHVESHSDHDRLLALMPPRSAVFSASLTEDANRSVVGDAAIFPAESIVCDMLAPFGKSKFLAEAVRQRSTSELTVLDGSTYASERRVAILQTMFGTEADSRQTETLRKALGKLES